MSDDFPRETRLSLTSLRRGAGELEPLDRTRMRALFDRFGFVAKTDPDEPQVVIYTATMADLVRAGEHIMVHQLDAATTMEVLPPAVVPAQ